LGEDEKPVKTIILGINDDGFWIDGLL